MPFTEETPIVIIGVGAAGLTLATLLHTAKVPCIVLERRSRTYVEGRQRAGVVDARGVRMFERWGLADQLLAGPVAQTIDYRINGVGRVFEIAGDDGSEGRFCTQQIRTKFPLANRATSRAIGAGERQGRRPFVPERQSTARVIRQARHPALRAGRARAARPRQR